MVTRVRDLAGFLSTLSLRRATRNPAHVSDALLISIHALLAESDNTGQPVRGLPSNFYPRSPCGERPIRGKLVAWTSRFLSTLSLRRATCRPDQHRDALPKFLSTLSLRRATEPARCSRSVIQQFLSTLSLRRATRPAPRGRRGHADFYPRSPCGERRPTPPTRCAPTRFLSTLSLRRATKLNNSLTIKLNDFYPRSPCGERPDGRPCKRNPSVFLSTLSLRRATPAPGRRQNDRAISIHALLAESDRLYRPARPLQGISIHALLAESDVGGAASPTNDDISIHALLAESDALSTCAE